jgi:hypothetical protein
MACSRSQSGRAHPRSVGFPNFLSCRRAQRSRRTRWSPPMHSLAGSTICPLAAPRVHQEWQATAIRGSVLSPSRHLGRYAERLPILINRDGRPSMVAHRAAGQAPRRALIAAAPASPDWVRAAPRAREPPARFARHSRPATCPCPALRVLRVRSSGGNGKCSDSTRTSAFASTIAGSCSHRSASSRKAKSARSARTPPSRSTSGSLPRPTKTSPRAAAMAGSARISTRVSPALKWCCRRCATASKFSAR